MNRQNKRTLDDNVESAIDVVVHREATVVLSSFIHCDVEHQGLSIRFEFESIGGVFVDFMAIVVPRRFRSRTEIEENNINTDFSAASGRPFRFCFHFLIVHICQDISNKCSEAFNLVIGGWRSEEHLCVNND